MPNKKTRLGKVFIYTFIAVSFLGTSKVSAEAPLTQEQIINLSTDIKNPNPYFDRFYFSDDFKSEVIEKEYQMTPSEYDNCIRTTAGESSRNVNFMISMNQIEDYSAKINIINKKIIDTDHERVNYEIIISYNDGEPIVEKTSDFSIFTKINGEWFIDLMPEYLEKKNTATPLDLCDLNHVKTKRKIEQAGLIVARNTLLSPEKIAIYYGDEVIAISDYGNSQYRRFRADLNRGEKKYELSFPSSTQDGGKGFLSENYDWSQLKANVDAAKKIADLLANNPVRYISQFGRYEFDFTPEPAGIWRSKAFVEIKPGAEKFYDRMREVSLIIDMNTGTVREDQQQQKAIDQKNRDFQDKLNSNERVRYLSSALAAATKTGAFLLLGLFMVFLAKKIVPGTIFSIRTTAITAILAALVWFVFAFMSSTSMTIKIMDLAPHLFAWPFGVIFGSFFIMYLSMFISIIIVGFIGFRFFRKSGLSRGAAVILIITLSIIQMMLISPLSSFTNKYIQDRYQQNRINF